jgi:hypothetical protein
VKEIAGGDREVRAEIPGPDLEPGETHRPHRHPAALRIELPELGALDDLAIPEEGCIGGQGFVTGAV